MTLSPTIEHAYPVGPLLELLARDAGEPVTILAAAVMLDVAPKSVHRWKHDGLTAAVADQVATRLGLHPDEIWGTPTAAQDGPDEPDPEPRATTLDEHRDRHLEALIAAHSITAELGWMPLDNIAWAATEDRQVRTELADSIRVDTYATAMTGGAVFPAGLGWPGPGGIEIVTGVHRARAYELAGRDQFPCYVAADDADSQALYLLAVEDNATHGLALTEDERIGHALRMIDLGRSVADAARRTGLSPSVVERAKKVRSSGTILAGFGIHTQWNRLSASSQWRLAMAARGNTEILAEAVCTAAGAGLRTVQCYELATQIGAALAADGTAGALQVIEDYEISHNPDTKAAARWSAGGTGGAAGSPVVTTRNLCRSLVELNVDRIVESCLPGDAAITVDLIKRTVTRLGQIGARLDTLAQGARP